MHFNTAVPAKRFNPQNAHTDSYLFLFVLCTTNKNKEMSDAASPHILKQCYHNTTTITVLSQYHHNYSV